MEQSETAPETPLAVQPSGDAAAELARLRTTLVAAYPEAVAELVSGESVGALLESLEQARGIYQRVAGEIAAARPEPTTPAPAVPAGDVRPLALDPDTLPPVEKIRRALAGR